MFVFGVIAPRGRAAHVPAHVENGDSSRVISNGRGVDQHRGAAQQSGSSNAERWPGRWSAERRTARRSAADRGGGARSVARARSPGDFDLATTALPDAAMKRARAAGFGVDPDRGQARHGDHPRRRGPPIEMTTLREESRPTGATPKCASGAISSRDARRRDFTINALSLVRDGRVHEVRRRCRYRRAPGSFHRRSRDPHPQGLPAQLAVFPVLRRLRRRAARRPKDRARRDP